MLKSTRQSVPNIITSVSVAEPSSQASAAAFAIEGATGRSQTLSGSETSCPTIAPLVPHELVFLELLERA